MSSLDCDSPSSSLKHKIHSSICFSCCFRSSAAAELDDDGHPPSLIRSSSTWIRSKAQEIPEIKEKCWTMISRVGRHHRRGGQFADFRYYPLSYALNFDEGTGDDLDFADEDEFQYRNFSSRLPASPPERPRAAAIGVACN